MVRPLLQQDVTRDKHLSVCLSIYICSHILNIEDGVTLTAAGCGQRQIYGCDMSTYICSYNINITDGVTPFSARCGHGQVSVCLSFYFISIIKNLYRVPRELLN